MTNAIPIKNDVSTSLDGLVVTPNIQHFKRSDIIKFNFFEIYNNEEILKKFRQFTFPNVQETSDGELFIDPHAIVISSISTLCVKWLLFDKDKNPIHGHDYPMVKMPKDGYLMKIVVPKVSDNPMDFEIEYFIKLTEIEVNSIQQIGGNQISDEISGDVELSIIPFSYDDLTNDDTEQTETSNNSAILELLTDKESFFKHYVKDVL